MVLSPYHRQAVVLQAWPPSESSCKLAAMEQQQWMPVLHQVDDGVTVAGAPGVHRLGGTMRQASSPPPTRGPRPADAVTVRVSAGGGRRPRATRGRGCAGAPADELSSSSVVLASHSSMSLSDSPYVTPRGGEPWEMPSGAAQSREDYTTQGSQYK